jgi:hypothetical protein
MTFTAALRRFDAAATRYREAVCEIAMLDALPRREGFMAARNAERADWHRKAAFAVREMRASVAEATALAGEDARAAARGALRAWRRKQRILMRDVA